MTYETRLGLQSIIRFDSAQQRDSRAVANLFN